MLDDGAIMVAWCPSCGNAQDAADLMCEVCGIDTEVVAHWEIPLDTDPDPEPGMPFLVELLTGEPAQDVEPSKGGG